MTELIERLRAATAGTAELDLAIGRVPSWPDGIGPVTPYTRSLDAAITLVPERLFWSVGSGVKGSYAWLGSGPFVEATTPALALCIAALMAREAA